MEKMAVYLKELDKQDIEIEVDGNITLEKAEILSGYGANIFVAGTSCLFTGSLDQYEGNLKALKQVL